MRGGGGGRGETDGQRKAPGRGQPGLNTDKTHLKLHKQNLQTHTGYHRKSMLQLGEPDETIYLTQPTNGDTG